MSKGVALTRLMWIAAVVAVVAAAVVAGAARADNPPPPLVSVGPVTDPTSTVTASGTASKEQTGKTDACVNQQHSGTAPPPSDAKNGVQVNDSSCQASTSTSGSGGGNGAGSSSGAGSRTVSSSSGSARKGTASTKRSRSASATVAAAQALGLRTPHIRYLTAAVQSSRSLRLLVTVRDLRGRLVRHAIVSIRGLPGVELTNEDEKVAGQAATITSTQATLSNRRGQAGFLVRVPKQSLGKRLLLLVAARTPKANALALGSVRLPGAAKPPA